MTQSAHDTILTTRLAALIGQPITFRLVGGHSTWGPYELVEFDSQVMVVKGSREYVVALEHVAVLHDGAKPTSAERYARTHGHLSVPGMPGVQIEGYDDATGTDDDDTDGADD